LLPPEILASNQSALIVRFVHLETRSSPRVLPPRVVFWAQLGASFSREGWPKN